MTRASRRALWAVALVGGLALAAFLARRTWTPKPAGAVWLDLVSELEHADAYHLPDYSLDFASPDAVRYLDERWLGIDPDTSVLESATDAAALRIPSIPAPMVVEIEIEPHWTPPSKDHRVVVSVNGKPRSRFDAPGRKRHRFRVPRGLLIDGDNVFEIECRGASFAVRGFRTAPATIEPGRFARGSVAAKVGPQPRILQVPGAHLSYSVRPPATASLVFRIPARESGQARYRVIAETDGERAEAIFDQVAQRGREVQLSLARFAGRPVRLSFEVRLAGGEPSPLAWEAPRIVIPPDRPAAPVARASVASPAPVRPPNIVLYVIDALRADHLEPYGYARDTSPRIAALAQEAVTFENAFSNSTWTKAAVGCLLTGRYPSDNGASNDVRSLDPAIKLLSTHLKARGYTCLGFQANGNAGSGWGFSRDFDVFLDEWHLLQAKRTWDSSEHIHRRLLERVDRFKEPFFLFIQSIDPHSPYEPHGEFRRYVEGDPLGRRPLREVFVPWLTRTDDGSPAFRQTTSFLIGLYDGSIRHNDAWFGKLMDLLRERGLYDDTAVFLTADHGEGFKDHGFEAGHGIFYQHTVRVPLILKLPRSSGARRSRVPVQHLDVAPTMLEMAGIEAQGLPGRSLLRMLAEDGAASPRSIHVQRYRDKDILRFPRDGRAVVSWPWKLIQENAWRPRYELYDLEKDPLETKNLWEAASLPSVRTGFLLQELRRLPAVLPSGVERRFTPEERESLKALGYIQ